MYACLLGVCVCVELDCIIVVYAFYFSVIVCKLLLWAAFVSIG